MGFSLMSFIIPTLNEEENLGNALESLRKQSFQNFEVVIADGGSTDRTRNIAEEYGCRFLRVPKTRPHDVSTAKNMGSKYAEGDALFFLDADMSLDPNALEVIDTEYDDPRVVGVALKVLPSDSSQLEVLLYNFNNVLAWMGNATGIHEFSYFSCHTYRTDSFMEVGGFRTDLLAVEDHDLSLRLRYLGRYVVTHKATLWTSPRRLREWSNRGYMMKYLKYLRDYYLTDKVNEYYDDLT
jgi:glycosyltransferase involved in cell wall biosynthesis